MNTVKLLYRIFSPKVLEEFGFIGESFEIFRKQFFSVLYEMLLSIKKKTTKKIFWKPLNLVSEANLTLVSQWVEILPHLGHLKSRGNNIPNVDVI